MSIRVHSYNIQLETHAVVLDGLLAEPTSGAHGVIVFAHGAGSSRHSPRNQFVARILQERGFATLLLDLLTHKEELEDTQTRHLRFDIDLLSKRLMGTVDWICAQYEGTSTHVGLFGASTGAAAAIVAAASRPDVVKAVVSRGGRPDLADMALAHLKAPTLFIVGARDFPVIEINEDALQLVQAVKHMELVPGATHLFEEDGALERVGHLAANWFENYLKPNREAEGAHYHPDRSAS